MYNLKSALLASLVALTLNAPAFAIDNSSAKQTYEPVYFEQYAPRTALGMVGRIPGFQVRGPDQRRGMGQGGANILINGERISGKTDPHEQLSRITAANVVRIEILDGTSLDIPGLNGDVANIITDTKGLSGTWKWQPQFRPDRDPNWWNGAASVSGQTGNITYSAKLYSRPRRQGHAGPETVIQADGTLLETAEEQAQYNTDNTGISADMSWKPKKDHVLNFNVKYDVDNFNLREDSQRSAYTPRHTSRSTIFSSAEDEWSAQIGGDYEFPLGAETLNGKVKFIGYYRTEHSPSFSRFDNYDAVFGHTNGSRFSRLADEAETIARAEYSWSPKKGQDWQLGVEGAFNYLDTTSNLRVRSAGGAFENIDLGADAASRVEEKRGEITLTHSRTMSPKLSLQLSVGGEYSQLSQNTGLSRDFFRPKGFLSTSYKHSDDLNIELKIEREVGQLRFHDFISSVSLQDDFDTTGNINLVPSQTWKGSLAFDKELGHGSTFRAVVFGRLISDLVDRIPIGIDGDAVGNIDSANLYGFELTSTIKGERWGLNGMELGAVFAYKKSSVDDPLTGVARRLNNDFEYLYSVNFRHDIQKTDWAYGTSVEHRINAPSYRIRTIGGETHALPSASMFIEHKDVLGIKARITLFNLLDQSDDFKRHVFTDRRDLGVLDYTEARERAFGRGVRASLSGTF